MTRPTTLPTWSTDTNFSSGPKSGLPTKVAPSAGEAAQGVVAGAGLMSGFVNYILNRIGNDWITHIDADHGGQTFGDASDGSATINGGTTTLSRDMYYDDLTITSTGVLATAGYRVFVRGTLQIDAGGVLSDNGAAGQDATGNPGGAGGTIHGQETLAQTFAGGNGGDSSPSSNGSAGNNATAAIGGNGGTGGSGDAGGSPQKTGGAGGTGTAPLGDDGGIYVLRAAPQAPLGRDLAGNRVGGGSGGGGGGGGRDEAGNGRGGGGGGTGGGVVLVCARLIANAGAIQAHGGDGGDGGSHASSAGGGGGGGGGGWVVLVRRARTGAGTVTASGGAGGAAGTGAAGATAGAAGAAGVVIVLDA